MESVEVNLGLIDINGISGITVGESFDVTFSASSASSEENSPIFSFYTDVTYDPTVISAEGIRYNDNGVSGAFLFSQSGSIDNAAGVLDEVGAISNIFSPVSEPTNVVFTTRFTLLKQENIFIGTNVADAPLSEVTLLGLDGDQRNNTAYGSLEINVGGGAPLVQGEQATIYVDAATNTVVGSAFQAGQAYAGLLSSNTDAEFGRGASSKDVVSGTNGSDNIWAGLEGNDLINARGGNDLVGMSLSDVFVNAGAGNDFVYGLGAGGGTNTVELGSGTDNFWAQGGNNVISGSGDNTIGLGSGSDVVSTGNGVDFIYNVNGGGGNNVLNLGNGRNILYLEGGNYTISTGSDVDIIGLGAGTDTVSAGGGDDVIYLIDDGRGPAGNKDILAGAGNDFIQTGSGDDLLEGGAGFDTVFGGSGADTFVIGAGGYSFVGDFELGVDLIELSGVSLGELDFFQGSGAVAADAFVFAGDEAIAQIANVDITALNNSNNFV